MKATEDYGKKSELGLVPQDAPKHELTREFYTKARNGKKRDYIYNVAKARKCPHPSLKVLAIGDNCYRCEECNWTYDIVTSNMQPLHNRILGSMMYMLHFVKEFGVGPFEEILRTPIGQYDGGPHKPAIPDGVGMMQSLLMMDSVNVKTDDKGDAELKMILDKFWVSLEERDRRQKQMDGKGVPGSGDQITQRGLNAGSSEERPELAGGNKGKRKKPKVRSLSE
jgi:hypothetical protein